MTRWAIALLLAVGPSPAAWAQDPRLAARLDPPTLAAVNALVDSARQAQLPTAPLVDKALEGAAKGSSGPKIVSAVRLLKGRLADSRRVLGGDATNAEIRAAASALDAGVTADDLARVHDASRAHRITVPLAVLTDLIGRDVPAPTAMAAVVALLRAGVRDGDFAMYQRNVRLDIERGADPGTAAKTRASGMTLQSSRRPRTA